VPSRVRKRDGREVPFDARKIEAAVSKALAAVGEDDPAFASEIAGVVTLTIEGRHGSGHPDAPDGTPESLPEIEEIQDLVEQALIELGRANVAKAYILYRDRRARAREALEVHEKADATRSLGRAVVEVQTPERTQPWSKVRIVAALINEAQLSREVAERVAASVEERVFAARWKQVSTALVRELVDNELVTLGLSSALQRQVSYGLPAYDLRSHLAAADDVLDPSRAVQGELLSGRGVDARIAGDVLRRWSLHEVLGPDSARAHLAGDLHLIEVSSPHHALTCAVPAQLVQAGGPEANAPYDALDELVEIARDVAHGVVLEDAATLLGSLSSAARSNALEAWLRALCSASCAAGRSIDLNAGGGGARAQATTDRLIETLAGLPPSVGTPRLFLDHAELARRLDDRSADSAFVAAAEALLVAGRLVPTWGTEDERCVGPGLHRFAHERAALTCGGAVALNLPRIALRAGPWREDRVLELLSNAARLAVDALGELANFQRRTRGSRPGDVRGRVAYAVTPVGLREALSVLGDGELRPDQGARIVGFLGEALQRAGEARRLAVVLTPYFGERVRARFAALDAELPQHAQKLLFSGGEEAPRRLPYGIGYRLSPCAGRAPWTAEAELLATVPVGALHPLPEDSSRGGILSITEAWKRFDRLRETAGADEAEERAEPARAPRSQASDSPLFDPTIRTSPGSARERASGPTG
jgi:hypothetical protein